MSTLEAPRLPEILARPANPRDFVTRAWGPSLAIPAVGAALTPCAPNTEERAQKGTIGILAVEG